MEEVKKSAVNLADHAAAYFNTLYNHTKVQATVKATDAASGTIMGIFIASLLFAALLFVGIATALWLGYVVNNTHEGFFIVAAAYLVAAVLLLLLRKQIITPIKNFIVKKIYG